MSTEVIRLRPGSRIRAAAAWREDPKDPGASRRAEQNRKCKRRRARSKLHADAELAFLGLRAGVDGEALTEVRPHPDHCRCADCDPDDSRDRKRELDEDRRRDVDDDDPWPVGGPEGRVY